MRFKMLSGKKERYGRPLSYTYFITDMMGLLDKMQSNTIWLAKPENTS